MRGTNDHYGVPKGGTYPGSLIASGKLLYKIGYADPSTGEAHFDPDLPEKADDAPYQETFAYDRQGRLAWRKGQAYSSSNTSDAATHTYAYGVDGQILSGGAETGEAARAGRFESSSRGRRLTTERRAIRIVDDDDANGISSASVDGAHASEDTVHAASRASRAGRVALMLALAEFALGCAAALVLWTLVRAPSPPAIAWHGLARIVREREYRTPLVIVLCCLALDMLQCTFDDRMTAWLGYDATGLIHALEGDVASGLQKLAWLPAIWVLAFFYVVMFPVVTLAPLLFLAATRRLAAYRALLAGVVVNYAACLPFYFFFPVKEMWAGNPGKVDLLLDRLSPAIMEAYRATSALDNCFPSFHTSLAVTSALIAWRTCPRPFAWAIAGSSALIVASTLYLGIHWATDVVAGTLLAIAATRLLRAGDEHTPAPHAG